MFLCSQSLVCLLKMLARRLWSYVCIGVDALVPVCRPLSLLGHAPLGVAV